MNSLDRLRASTCALFILAASASSVQTQTKVEYGIGPDSVTVIAATGLGVSPTWRKLFGDNYRDLWTLPTNVPVLHIDKFDGGITPTELGGGKQTKSLHLVASDSIEYVFRPIYKSGIRLPEDFRGTVVWKIFHDQLSASHPGANVVMRPMMESTGFLNPHQRLIFMPEDAPLSGEFKEDFAGVLGTLEDFPVVPKSGRAFAGAVKIYDAEELLAAINKDPTTQVDVHHLLLARLIDLWVGDNDRHADQWRWAQLRKDAVLEPIGRDRDKVFVSFNGIILNLARHVSPALVRFDSSYSDPVALFENATNFDRRMLGGVDKSEWELAARELQAKLTDAMIDSMISAMPGEYATRSAAIAAKLRARRATLPQAALRYFGELFALADVHGTDTTDVAHVSRNADGSVDVTIAMPKASPWFRRHYDQADTHEIRIYLHGGDDSAVVAGNAASSIPVRVIGGNGTNRLVDKSVVASRRNPTRLFDQGHVTDVKYGRDTVLEQESYVDALDSYYNRRPMVHAFGRLQPPRAKEFGAAIVPVGGLKTGHGLGIVPKVGMARFTYGFRKIPYSTMIEADAGYSTGARGWKFDVLGDKRFESSDFHIPAAATMSQIEVTQFRGLGNHIAEDDDPFFDVNQTQWQFRPAVGYSFAPGSDLTIGPIIRRTTTDSARNNFTSSLSPYGFKTFSQAGVRLALTYDTHVQPDTMKPRLLADLIAIGYPGVFDAKSAYESLEGVVQGYLTIPLLTKPVIALRAGGKKLYGNFPYFDAAFLGGGSSSRAEHRQRYAGDASLYGSAELRVPIVRFPTVVPTDVGALAFTDAGRVYMDGESPGGWHTAAGAGFWIGAINAGTNVNVLFTNRSNRRVMVSLGFAY